MAPLSHTPCQDKGRPTPAAGVPRRPRPLASRPWLAGLFVSAAVALHTSVALALSDSKRRIAVLPFTIHAADPQMDNMSVGLAYTLSSFLSNAPTVTLVERNRLNAIFAEQYRGVPGGYVDPKTAAQVGQVVGATDVVLGTCQRYDNSVVLTAQLVDTTTTKISPGSVVTGARDALVAIQIELALNLLVKWDPLISDEVRQALANKPTENAEAYHEFCLALFRIYQAHRSRVLGEEPQAAEAHYKAAEERLLKATRLDPNFIGAGHALKFVQWSQPNRASTAYCAQIDYPYGRVFKALLAAIPNAAGGTKVTGHDRAKGSIHGKQSTRFTSWGINIGVELTDLGRATGMKLYTVSKGPFGKVKPIYDYGQSKTLIKGILRELEKELQSGARQT